jgi:hypothetical protein
MTYDYPTRAAWVDELGPGPAPEVRYDLCTAHAASFSVPQGWTRTDRRSVVDAAAADDTPVPAPS